MTTAEMVLDCRNSHGEGILWNDADQRVWWTDIHGQALWALDPETRAVEDFALPERVCCFAPRAGGGLIVGFADGFAYFDPSTGAREPIAAFEPDNPHTRLNDGRTDRQGRLIAGGMNEGTGAYDTTVVRVDADGGIAVILDGVSCANSTCFSPDGRTMYFADTPVGEIWAYDYDPATGTPGARRTLASFEREPGLPDGSCVDAEGGVWNAEWNGHRVVRIAPDGTIDHVIDVPVLNPTCCAFGGRDLDTLYITTSRLMMTDEQLEAEPTSGSLYAVKPGVKGLHDAAFAG